jgi:hypothetical protein
MEANKRIVDCARFGAVIEYLRTSRSAGQGSKMMSMVSVQAVYDGKKVTFLEPPPVHGPYRVVVTFIEPAKGVGAEMLPRDPARFWASFGAWQDDRPVEATLRDIHEARRSRTEPPVL